MSLAETNSDTTSESLENRLCRLLGRDRVLTDEASRAFYAHDVSTKSVPALAVIRPGSVEELAAAVAAVTEAGRAVIARGGGMSYTAGYVPRDEGSVIVDLQAMDAVLEVNTEDMYVTVQAGCTWQKLADTLAGTGCRTPFWGTLSGIHATVGGGMSQNSVFWGSGRHGTAADSVIGFEVVLADGSIVRTGAAAQREAAPFFRHYGPDLTGLFTCDTGALGLKATVTLRLIPVREHRAGLSFDFDDYRALAAAMSEISRGELADECFAFDPRLSTVRMQRDSLLGDAKKLAGVIKSSGSVLKALKDGTRIAVAGRGYMKDVRWSLHVMIEERTAAAADAGAAAVRAICETSGGREIANSIPAVLRANPFTPLNNIAGPNGERWLPIHTIVPHSKAITVLDDVATVFEAHDAEMNEHGIGYGLLLATVATSGFVVEPVFFIPDALDDIQKATIEDRVLEKLPGFEANPAARAAAEGIKRKLIDRFRKSGGIHMQIGKTYPYRDGLRPESWQVVDRVKDALDPDRRVNPGSLGLD